MSNIDEAVRIAKEINPEIGPTLDLERKTLSEGQFKAKLKRFFEINKKAADVILSHPGKNYEEIKQSFDLNVEAHTRASVHITAFVNDVLARKDDLRLLAESAARRIVLSDPRIATYWQTNPKADKVKISQEIAQELQNLLAGYFENLKGKELDRLAIIEELSRKVTTKVAEMIKVYAGGK